MKDGGASRERRGRSGSEGHPPPPTGEPQCRLRDPVKEEEEEERRGEGEERRRREEERSRGGGEERGGSILVNIVHVVQAIHI